MSDVLPSSNQEALSSAPTPKNQAAIERLRKRMEGYRDMQNSRLPQYDQTMNHMNTQQIQETLVLRQKFLESKAKKPNKKSSSASADKMKHDMAANSSMNGIMQFHGHPGANGPPGSHNGPPMGHNMNGPPMGHNGPQVGHNGPMLQNGPPNMMHHGPSGPGHNKRPLEDDSSNIQSDTAKRLNLDNGNISDQNFMKREPSPMESKFNPVGGHFARMSPHQQQVQGPSGLPPHSAAKPPTSQPSPSPDVKPNVNTLNQEIQDNANSDSKPPNHSSKEIRDNDDIKAETYDRLKQDDTLGDFDLKDFDFDGMNADSLQDLMDDLPENFIDTFDFENSKIASDDKDNEDLSNPDTSESGSQPTATSTVSSCHSSSSTTTSVSQSNHMPNLGPGGPPGANGPNGPPTSAPNAAEALKLMAQQHQQPQGSQQPPSSQAGPPFQGQMNPNMFNNLRPNYPVPSSAMNSGGSSMVSSTSAMNQANIMSESTASMMGHGPRGPVNMQDGDPRLRAAVQQRFRLGNPNSMANNMGPGPGPGPGPGMNSHAMMANQRMPQMGGNSNMMGSMGGNQPGMGGNMQMMNQQQVRYYSGISWKSEL